MLCQPAADLSVTVNKCLPADLTALLLARARASDDDDGDGGGGGREKLAFASCHSMLSLCALAFGALSKQRARANSSRKRSDRNAEWVIVGHKRRDNFKWTSSSECSPSVMSSGSVCCFEENGKHLATHALVVEQIPSHLMDDLCSS
ncbi:hypothetical protein TTRE_0000004801 [Trichuris trichiura]|uniref:Uncharacterized protein n=1 Tax=Trichuris trichiura TaxID=36087 RepID=A0A077YVL9_TRITR|nr:hypothetical protein TTRE_0000004801 [Trichuris trichiura]